MSKKPTKTKAPQLRAWAADKIERWALDEIKPYPRNARLHDQGNVEAIAASMRKFGMTTPVLVDEDGVLLYGHGRRAAAALLVERGQAEFGELPVVVARGWTEDEKRAYRITDNQSALTSSWDLPVLRAEVASLASAGFDLPVLGFPETKLVQFMSGPRIPDGFKSFGEDVPTEFCCPSCKYRWSGRPDAGEQKAKG